MNRLKILFFVCFLLPVSGKAFDKLQLELMSPKKVFQSNLGSLIEIKFKALSNKSNLKYLLVLRPADMSKKEGRGLLSQSPLDLKMGENLFSWKGERVMSFSENKVKTTKLSPGKYYLQILIIESEEPIVLFGENTNYHKKVISKLKIPQFVLK